MSSEKRLLFWRAKVFLQAAHKKKHCLACIAPLRVVFEGDDVSFLSQENAHGYAIGVEIVSSSEPGHHLYQSLAGRGRDAIQTLVKRVETLEGVGQRLETRSALRLFGKRRRDFGAQRGVVFDQKREQQSAVRL